MSHTTSGATKPGREDGLDELSDRVAMLNEILGAGLVLLVALILLWFVKAQAAF